MTLSFTAHWHDELPGFYTALKPTPLQNSRLIWHNDRLADELAVPPEMFQPPTALASGQDNWAMAGGSCWANNGFPTERRWTGT